MTDRPTTLELALNALDDLFVEEIKTHTKNAQIDHSIRLQDRYGEAKRYRDTCTMLAIQLFKT